MHLYVYTQIRALTACILEEKIISGQILCKIINKQHKSPINQTIKASYARSESIRISALQLTAKIAALIIQLFLFQSKQTNQERNPVHRALTSPDCHKVCLKAWASRAGPAESVSAFPDQDTPSPGAIVHSSSEPSIVSSCLRAASAFPL